MRIRLILAGAVAVPLTLSACGGGDDPIADPPVSSAPTSSATPSAHRESAEHFIRRWADAEMEMQNRGETHTYLSLSRGCHACSVLANTVDRYYASGGY